MLKEDITSFYPGPSQLYPQIKSYLEDAVRYNICGYNHRSNVFVDIIEQLNVLFVDKLGLPKDYRLGFTCSATEVWGLLAQSFQEFEMINYYNGSFGKKWAEVNLKYNRNAFTSTFTVQDTLPLRAFKDDTVICVCMNETSNGTFVTNEILKDLRFENPNSIIAVDATSCMGGVKIDFENADIWFASVQKCFGLPPGLGLVLMAPRLKSYFKNVIKVAYNNIEALYDYSLKYQTIHTPNTLNLYLLNRLLGDIPSIKDIDILIQKRTKRWDEVFDELGIRHLCLDPYLRSSTVFTIQSKPDDIKLIESNLLEDGLMIGKGYGELKEQTFRIANFPAITNEMIIRLEQSLSKLDYIFN